MKDTISRSQRMAGLSYKTDMKHLMAVTLVGIAVSTGLLVIFYHYYYLESLINSIA